MVQGLGPARGPRRVGKARRKDPLTSARSSLLLRGRTSPAASDSPAPIAHASTISESATRA